MLQKASAHASKEILVWWIRIIHSEVGCFCWVEIILDEDVYIVAPLPDMTFQKQHTYICTIMFEHYVQAIIGGNTMMNIEAVAKSNFRPLKHDLVSPKLFKGAELDELICMIFKRFYETQIRNYRDC